ncbi:MAG: Cna B-type domain-containing protein, partial [Blautia sp.]|nr:Cna B-type domain-containing protein [Blautia sp.]
MIEDSMEDSLLEESLMEDDEVALDLEPELFEDELIEDEFVEDELVLEDILGEVLPEESLEEELPQENLVVIESDLVGEGETTSLAVSLAWFDSDGTTPLTASLPEPVKVILSRKVGDGNFQNVTNSTGQIMALSLTAAENWSGTFRDLVAQDESGNAYTYEATPAEGANDFTYTVTAVEGGVQIKLVKKPPITTVTVSVHKYWANSAGTTLAESERPASAIFTLKRKIATVDNDYVAVKGSDGNDITLTVNAASTWRASVSDLPVKDEQGHDIDYTIEEAVPEGFVADTSVQWNNDGAEKAYTVTNKKNTMSLSIALLFLEADGTTPVTTGLPDSVTVSIRAKDIENPPTYTKEFSQSAGWTQTFTDIVNAKYNIVRPDLAGFVRDTSIKSVGGVYQVKYIKKADITGTPTPGVSIPVRAVFYDTDGTTVLTTGLPTSVTVAITYAGVQYKTTLRASTNFVGSFENVVISGTASYQRSIPSGFVKKDLRRWGDGYSFNYIKADGGKIVPVRAVFYDSDGRTILKTGLPTSVKVVLVYDDDKEYSATLTGPEFEGTITGITSTGSVKTAKRSIPSGFEKVNVTKWTSSSGSGYSFNYKKIAGTEEPTAEVSTVEPVSVATTEEPTTEDHLEPTTAAPVTEPTTEKPTEPTTEGNVPIPAGQGLSLKVSRVYTGEDGDEEYPLVVADENLYFAVVKEGETAAYRVVMVNVRGDSEGENFVSLPAGAYRIFESDAQGTIRTPTAYETSLDAGGDMITIDPGYTKYQDVKHVYEVFPAGNYVQGQLSITKEVYNKDNAPRHTDETFYVGIFKDREHKELAENLVDSPILSIEMENQSEQTSFVWLRLTPETSEYQFYLAEVDEEGNPVVTGPDFPYTPEFDEEGMVEISFEESEASVTLSNVFTGEVPLTPSITITPTPTLQEGSGVVVNLSRKVRPKEDPDVDEFYIFEADEYPLYTPKEEDFVCIYPLEDEDEEDEGEDDEEMEDSSKEKAGSLHMAADEDDVESITIVDDYTSSIRVS